MNTDSHHSGCSSATYKWVLGGLLVIAAFFLFTEHRAHLFGILPYLLLLSCPLMHLFMHHGHGTHQHHADPDNHQASSTDSTQHDHQKQLGA